MICMQHLELGHSLRQNIIMGKEVFFFFLLIQISVKNIWNSTTGLCFILFYWLFFRGLPIWLREIPNITFRSDNQPFMVFLLYLITYQF